MAKIDKAKRISTSVKPERFLPERHRLHGIFIDGTLLWTWRTDAFDLWNCIMLLGFGHKPV